MVSMIIIPQTITVHAMYLPTGSLWTSQDAGSTFRKSQQLRHLLSVTESKSQQRPLTRCQSAPVEYQRSIRVSMQVQDGLVGLGIEACYLVKVQIFDDAEL